MTTALVLAAATSLPTGPIGAVVMDGAVGAQAQTETASGPLLVSVSPFESGIRTASAYRVRHRSVAVDGRSIEVTGVAFVPKGRAPSGGWPVLSFAHGTVGLADRCAPSADTRLSEITATAAGLLTAFGIAIVQSDYEGLGTPGRHPYLVGESEGRGVLDIVRASREIPGANLSNRVIVWGHSQGGHAALFAGEIAPTWAPDLRILGIVAGAPPSQLTNVAGSIENSPFRGYVFMVAAGLHAADPSLPLDAVLTPKGMATLPVVDTGCNREVFAAFRPGSLDDYVMREGLLRSPWKEALERNEPGNRPIAAPVLIVHGDRDEQIPVATSATLRTKLCRLGVTVDRKVYRGADHAGAALVSLFDVSSWITKRLAGAKAPSSCPRR
jgi:pimeloyl-ACP methyl ester carboxylesterase